MDAWWRLVKWRRWICLSRRDSFPRGWCDVERGTLQGTLRNVRNTFVKMHSDTFLGAHMTSGTSHCCNAGHFHVYVALWDTVCIFMSRSIFSPLAGRRERREVWAFGLPGANSVRERVLTKHNTSRADGGDCCIRHPTGTFSLIRNGSPETTTVAGEETYERARVMYSHLRWKKSL